MCVLEASRIILFVLNSALQIILNIMRRFGIRLYTRKAVRPGFMLKKEFTLAKPISLDYMQWSVCRAAGPGGQNVNKVNTKVDMRFMVDTAEWLSPEVRQNIRDLFPNKVNRAGEFVVSCDVHRTQDKNIQEALAIMKLHIDDACLFEVPRKMSKPPASANENRLKRKKHHSEKLKRRNGRNERM